MKGHVLALSLVCSAALSLAASCGSSPPPGGNGGGGGSGGSAGGSGLDAGLTCLTMPNEAGISTCFSYSANTGLSGATCGAAEAVSSCPSAGQSWCCDDQPMPGDTSATVSPNATFLTRA